MLLRHVSSRVPAAFGEGYRAQVIAFFRPQPIDGGAPARWEAVKHSLPCFPGHRQPRVPSSLGYYDLSDPDTHQRQASLARNHGVGAFCYQLRCGKDGLLPQQPLELLAARGDLSMPFCVSWTGNDEPGGSSAEDQQTASSDQSRVIDWLAEYLGDSRYTRVGGRPLLLVFRGGIREDPMRATDTLRQRAADLGLGELHLAMVQTNGAWDPRGAGFDSAVEYPTGDGASNLIGLRRDHPVTSRANTSRTWAGRLFSYPALIEWALSKPVPEFVWFRGAMTGWDDTPIRAENGAVFAGDDADLFQMWLERALHYTYLFNAPGERLLFVNAWNEWSDGAYLEPDLETGTSKLEAIARALVQTDELALETAEADSQRSELLLAARAYFRSAAVLSREVLCQYEGL